MMERTLALPRALVIGGSVGGLFAVMRAWVAAGAAAAKTGGPRAELRYHHLVPEWITGMGIVVGQA